MKITIKSIILLILISLCIYQVTILWSSFLISDTDILGLGIGESGQDVPFDEQAELLTPNKLGVYLEREDGKEGKTFTVVKRTTLYYDMLFQSSAEALISALSSGEKYGNDVEIESLFESRSLFFTLHKNLDPKELARHYDIDEGMLEGIDEVTSFGIVLSFSSDAYTFAYLIDTKGTVKVYRIIDDKTERVVKNLNFFIDEIQDQGDVNAVYVSSQFEGLQMLNSHVLLPTDLKTYTKEIYFETSFIESDTFQYEMIEDYVNGFEPGAKWVVDHGDTIGYGNDEMTISYNKAGVFEYQYLSESFEEALSLAESYHLAKSFLQKDRTLGSQEYYLKNYVETDEGYEFYYGYSYNDFPLIIESDYAKRLGVFEPMVIEIKGNQVASYKRVLITMDEDVVQDVKKYNSNYSEVLLEFLSEEETVMPIDDMFLGFFWDEEDTAKMRWIIDYNQVYYSRRM